MLISIDHDDSRPIYQQIASAVKQQLCSGQIEPGDELPSVRDMASALGVNLHTVRHAYRLLSEQGVVRLGLARRARVLPPAANSPDNRLLTETLIPRIKELVVDAMQLGLSDDDLRQLVDRTIKISRERKDK